MTKAVKSQTALVVGGTSGLGLLIAKGLRDQGYEVHVTGRRNLAEDGILLHTFDLTASRLPERTKELIEMLPTINVLVYAAGYFQDGRVTDLSNQEIEEMFDVGGRGLVYFVKSVLDKQGELDELITITSTSQWTPRQREPVYNFVKAGAAHLSNSLAHDGRVKKVLVAGPAGMKTNFWQGTQRDDLSEMLDPEWVSAKIIDLREGNYNYRFAKIMRQPSRVEIVETIT
jgi:short-subunit dehydrogenase